MIHMHWSRVGTPLPGLFTFVSSLVVAADIPAIPVLTLYRFNGDLTMPYYDSEQFLDRGAVVPTGSLAQGATLIPRLVLRDGCPVTNNSGIPCVGFEEVGGMCDMQMRPVSGVH